MLPETELSRLMLAAGHVKHITHPPFPYGPHLGTSDRALALLRICRISYLPLAGSAWLFRSLLKSHFNARNCHENLLFSLHGERRKKPLPVQNFPLI